MKWLCQGDDYVLQRDGIEAARIMRSGASDLYRVQWRSALGKPSTLSVAKQIAESLARFG